MTRPVRIIDPRHFDAEVVLAPIVERESLGATLAFIKTRARADRIDIAPIVFGLRVNDGITVNLRCGGLQNLCLYLLCRFWNKADNSGYWPTMACPLMTLSGRSNHDSIAWMVDTTGPGHG